MDWLSTWTHWHWLILGFVLLIAEIIIPGVFLLWWGLAAIFTACIATLFPTISLSTLAYSYAILATILSVLWWKYQHSKDRADDRESVLNQRDHAMIGEKGMVEEIAPNGIGRGRFGDTTWRIQGEQLNCGNRVQVQSVQGITLNVIKID